MYHNEKYSHLSFDCNDILHSSDTYLFMNFRCIILSFAGHNFCDTLFCNESQCAVIFFLRHFVDSSI